MHAYWNIQRILSRLLPLFEFTKWILEVVVPHHLNICSKASPWHCCYNHLWCKKNLRGSIQIISGKAIPLDCSFVKLLHMNWVNITPLTSDPGQNTPLRSYRIYDYSPQSICTFHGNEWKKYYLFITVHRMVLKFFRTFPHFKIPD